MTKKLYLLVEGSEESGLAQIVLGRREIKFETVDVRELPGPTYPRCSRYPSLIVDGTYYIGLNEVKRVANCNLYL